MRLMMTVADKHPNIGIDTMIDLDVVAAETGPYTMPLPMLVKLLLTTPSSNLFRAPATTQGHVPHQPVSDPYQSPAAPATTQGHVPSWYEDAMATQQRFRQDLLQRMREREQWRRDLDRMSNPHQSLGAPATTQGHVPNNLSLYHDAMATQRRILQDAMQRHAQFRRMIDLMQREGVQQAAASRQRQLAWLGSNGQAPF